MNAKKYIINDKEYNVAINSYTGNYAEVTVNGVVYQVKIEDTQPVAPSQAPAPLAAQPSAPVASAPEAPTAVPGAGKPVNSPLPGVIVGIKVKVGDVVKPGQVVAILEAMKMENEIQAEFGGTVTAVNVSEGASILEGAAIVTIG